jgi:ubiquinol-cytochrome c reductase cytochrome c subunit
MRRGAVALAAAILAVLGIATLPAARAQDASPEPGSIERGAALYRAGCTTCHGADGEGVEGWPSIADAGAAAADFQLRTGRMPFVGERGEQALPKPPAYDEQEIRDLVAFVATLGDGPAIPAVAVDDGLVPAGQRLFAANCAPCHGASANGGAVGGGAIAWPLTEAGPLTVAEAMVTGPGQMPVFDWPEDDRNAVVTYVAYLQDAPNPGGFPIGGIGPVPEGLVAWFVGMGLLLVIVYLVGREWTRRDGEPT